MTKMSYIADPKSVIDVVIRVVAVDVLIQIN